MKTIKRTITGMVFEDYQAGDIPQLERKTSVFDKLYHKFVPTGGFMLGDSFATYNIDENFLHHAVIGTPYANCSIEDIPMSEGLPTKPYRSNIKLQKHQKDVFERISADNPQIFLNIPTATGKTVLSVHRIAKLQVKTIIICFKKKILYQWYETFRDKTDIDINRVMVIDSSQYFLDLINGSVEPEETDIWLVTPNLINSFCSHNGWEVLYDLFEFMGIGFKVFDEAHRCFATTVKINAHTSTRTLYLSADCMQANPDVRKLYFDALRDAILIRYDKETLENLKHITCVQYEYSSFPTLEDTAAVTNMARKNKYHWDHFNFTRYYMDNGIVVNHVLNVLNEIIKNEPVLPKTKPYKILILTNMIDAVDMVYREIKTKINERSVSRYHTKIEKTESLRYLSADIIVSTYQAFAEGVDITNPKIKHVISMNPVDPILANQAAGRCRPIEGEDSFFWMMVDKGFSYCLHNELKVAQYLTNSKIGKIIRIDG